MAAISLNPSLSFFRFLIRLISVVLLCLTIQVCDYLDDIASNLSGVGTEDQVSNGSNSISVIPYINYMTFDSANSNGGWPFIDEFAYVEDVFGDQTGGPDTDIVSVGLAHNFNNLFFIIRTDETHDGANGYFYDITFDSDRGTFTGTMSQASYDQVSFVPVASSPSECADGPEVMNFAAEGNATLLGVPVGSITPLSCFSNTPDNITSVTINLYDISTGDVLDDIEFGFGQDIPLESPDDEFVHMDRTSAPAGDTDSFNEDTNVSVFFDGESDFGAQIQGVSLATDSTGEDLFIGLMTANPIDGVNYAYDFAFYQDSELRASVRTSIFFSLSDVESFNSDDGFALPICSFIEPTDDIEGYDAPEGAAGYRYSVRLDLQDCLGLDPDEEFDTVVFTISDTTLGQTLDQFDFHNFSFAEE